MITFGTIHEVLTFAINSEQEAVEFYTTLAAKSRNKSMREVFTEFALEEMGHKKRLLEFLNAGLEEWRQETITDLKIADYTPVISAPNGEMTYQEALIVAMHKEKAAFRLYTDLAAASNNPETKRLFGLLAMEESKHKLRFELEYDEVMLSEN